MRTLSAIAGRRGVARQNFARAVVPRRMGHGVRAAAPLASERPASFTPLIDAKAASALLGVPYTWLLAQAREGRIPHHRLGHYVRFNPDDLAGWLQETKDGPGIRQVETEVPRAVRAIG